MLAPDPIDWSDPAHPRSTHYGDAFAPRAGALAQAEAVFLRGNGLPERWHGRDRFVVLETGFGLGNNFLATWDHWRRDPTRSRRLFFLSLDAHPVGPDDLARAHAHSPLQDLANALQAQWPPRVPGLHRLDFDDGAVQLLLAFGDVKDTLGQFQARVDAFFLDGFAPRLNPAMWSREALAPLSRLAATGATAATWSAARSVREALQASGFECQLVPGFGGKAEQTVARFRPPQATQPPGRQALAPGVREAVVVGAGIAGAACAHVLQRAGLRVRVLDAEGPAAGASGNPVGLFHATQHGEDGPHARWSRAAALRTRQWVEAQGLRHLRGLLRLQDDAAAAAPVGPDPSFAEWLSAERSAQRAGLAHTGAAWFYPGGGALDPAAWVRHLLQGVAPERRRVARLLPLPDSGDAGGADARWRLLDAEGRCVASSAMVVLACGHALPQLLEDLHTTPDDALPLRSQRGALSWWRPAALGGHVDLARPVPRCPVASGGYVLGWGDDLVAGATATFDDFEPSLRPSDHAHNRRVAERLTGRPLPEPLDGRVAWRLLAADKLPVVGGLARADARPARDTQGSSWPRRPGLAVLGALASRGLTWAPLAAELLGALALGDPLPVERRLVDAVDPARWLARRARQA